MPGLRQELHGDQRPPVLPETDRHKEIVESLALLAEGMRISRFNRVKGFKEDTILEWLRQAAEQAEQIEAVLMDR